MRLKKGVKQKIMLKFISFGSGSSGNCYILVSDEETLMIDSGIGIRSVNKYLHDFGIPLNSITGILVTHDHADHVKAVGALSNKLNIPVYATEAVHKGIEANYCVRKKVDVANKITIKSGETFTVGKFSITPFDVPHDSKGNVGYRIEKDGTVFCLMTDIGHVTDDIRRNISLANYLVIEANHDKGMLADGPYPQYLKERVAGDYGHMSNTTCAEAIRECATEKLKHIWLCHLSEENNHPELLRKTMEEVLSQGTYKIGKDFIVDILKRKTPMGAFELN
mgnify:CR=1 FL=1